MPEHDAAPRGRTPLMFTLEQVEFGDSGAGEGQRTLRGHAAVYNRLSHDLGGFRTKIKPGAFTKVLDAGPDVHLVWDHDTRYVLARTTNKTLELREDPMGLHVWARLADTSYARDLAILMERGDIDQMSFACDIGEDAWTENADGEITREIQAVQNLYDVTVCAQGAFPQTDSSLLASAIEAGRVTRRAPEEAAAAPRGLAGRENATAAPQDGLAGPESAAPDQGGRRIAALQAHARQRALTTKTRRS